MIETVGLTKRYRDRIALADLNLKIERGDVFGFIGPNGAGKSTTIRMLTGLIPPTSGSIELLGMSMPDQGLEIKKRIGLIPDESLLFDRITGAEFLEFVGRMYGLARPVARERARALLGLFELEENSRKLIEHPEHQKSDHSRSKSPRQAVFKHVRILSDRAGSQLARSGPDRAHKKNLANTTFQNHGVSDKLFLARLRNKRVFRGNPGTLVGFPPLSSQRS